MPARFSKLVALGGLLATGAAWEPLALAQVEATVATPATLSGASLVTLIGPRRGAGERRVQAPRGAALQRQRARRPTRYEKSGRPLAANAAAETSREPPRAALRAAELLLFPRRIASTPARGLPAPVPREGPVVRTTGLPLAPSRVAEATSSASPSNRDWLRRLHLPNLPVSFEERTLRYLDFYQNSRRGRSILQAWARRAGRYSGAIVQQLADAGLPTDLVWMSLVESGHNPTVRSRAGAAGLWQFIPESARYYGLAVNRWVDERLDPMRSTQAAILLLKDLKTAFGTWDLAMAAYNMGKHGLTRSIRRYNSNDFWRLSRLEAALPWETTLYVPKVLAVAIAMNNRHAFGFADVAPEAAINVDVVQAPPGLRLTRLAKNAGLPASALVDLNPQYLVGRTPPARNGDSTRWNLNVPRGLGERIAGQLAARDSRLGPTIVVRQGDTLPTIAARLRIAEADLRRLNALGTYERLQPGTRLLIPTGEGPDLAPPADREDVIVLPPHEFAYPERKRVFYRTSPGDDLASIAHSLHATREELALWNHLDPRARLQSDMTLQAYVPQGHGLEGVRAVDEKHAGRRLRAGSTAFLDHFEAERGRRRLLIRAKEGDTLRSIGKRYGLSAGMMERINHLSRRKRLREGRPVVVYARYEPPPSEVLLTRGPERLPPVDPPHPGVLPSPL